MKTAQNVETQLLITFCNKQGLPMNRQQNFSSVPSVNTPGEIIVRLTPSAKEEHVEKRENIYYVSVKEPALKDKANIALIKLLSKLLGKQLRIKKGRKSKEKTLISV